MARYLKPTFLRWPAELVPTLFLKDVFQEWAERCQRVGLKLGAVLGRPLCVCTRRLPSGEVCGAMAAMSPLMEQRKKHKEFVCKDCAGNCDSAEHQALPVLRLVRLYAQVWVEDRCLAMRTAPMHILVHAPKDDSVWGIGHNALDQPDPTLLPHPARPVNMEIVDPRGFSYSDRESQNIWLYASHFQDAT